MASQAKVDTNAITTSLNNLRENVSRLWGGTTTTPDLTTETLRQMNQNIPRGGAGRLADATVQAAKGGASAVPLMMKGAANAAPQIAAGLADAMPKVATGLSDAMPKIQAGLEQTASNVAGRLTGQGASGSWATPPAAPAGGTIAPTSGNELFQAKAVMPGVTEISTPGTRAKGTRFFTDQIESGASPQQIAAYEGAQGAPGTPYARMLGPQPQGEAAAASRLPSMQQNLDALNTQINALSSQGSMQPGENDKLRQLIQDRDNVKMSMTYQMRDEMAAGNRGMAQRLGVPDQPLPYKDERGEPISGVDFAQRASDIAGTFSGNPEDAFGFLRGVSAASQLAEDEANREQRTFGRFAKIRDQDIEQEKAAAAERAATLRALYGEDGKANKYDDFRSTFTADPVPGEGGKISGTYNFVDQTGKIPPFGVRQEVMNDPVFRTYVQKYTDAGLGGAEATYRAHEDYIAAQKAAAAAKK